MDQQRYLKLGINGTAIAKLVGVSRPTLRAWIGRNARVEDIVKF